MVYVTPAPDNTNMVFSGMSANKHIGVNVHLSTRCDTN